LRSCATWTSTVRVPPGTRVPRLGRAACSRVTTRSAFRASRIASRSNSSVRSATGSPGERALARRGRRRRRRPRARSSRPATARPPQHGLDARDELARRERLRDVVVGAELEPDDAVGLLVARRQHQDRDARAAADAAGRLEAVDVRQPEIEDDDPRAPPVDGLEPAFAALFADDLEPGTLEVCADERADRVVVFDDDGDAAHGRTALTASAR
jgi:hypothetical protein